MFNIILLYIVVTFVKKSCFRLLNGRSITCGKSKGTIRSIGRLFFVKALAGPEYPHRKDMAADPGKKILAPETGVLRMYELACKLKIKPPVLLRTSASIGVSPLAGTRFP